MDLVFCQPLEIFSSEETAGEGAPPNEAVFIIFEQPQVLHLVLFSSEHVVLILSSNGFVKVQSFANGKCVEDCLCVPVGRGPIKSLSCFDHFMETATDLFERCEVIVEMRIDDVDVVHLQSFEGAVQALLYVFATDEMVGVDIRLGSNADLGGDDHLLSCHSQVLQDFSELRFGLTLGVLLGGIEMVDSVFEGGPDHLFIDLVVFLPEVDHVAEGDDRGKQARVAEVAVQHLAGFQQGHIFR